MKSLFNEGHNMNIKQIITIGVAEAEVLGDQYGVACCCRPTRAVRGVIAQMNWR